MPADNNQFSKDDNSIRSQRLTTISDNVDDYATPLALPPALVTAVQGMSAAWDAAVAKSDEKAGLYTIKLNNVRNLKKPLKAKFVAARKFLTDQIGNAEPNNEGYLKLSGLNEVISVNYAAFATQVEKLLSAQVKFAAQNIGALLPDGEAAALQALLTPYKAEIVDLDDTFGDKVLAKNDERALFKAHSKILTEVRNRALFKWPKDHPNFYFLGMAPEEEQTGQGSPDTPAPTYEEPNFMWAATANTTSYDVETSTDEGVTTNEVLSAENVLQVAVPRGAEEIWARVRSRNANGVSDWSPWLIIAAMTPDMPGNLMHTPGDPGVTTCVVPPGAITVRMFYQPDGHPKTEIGVMTNGSYPWTLWLTPGTIFAQAEYPGGIVSAQATLRVE